jgi:uncharacterized protein YndB with AHSA1/START domain
MKKIIEVATRVRAEPHAVWQAMVARDTALFPDSRVDTDWQVGHPIEFSGNWRGRPYLDRGEVKEFEQDRRLSFTYWCDLADAEGAEANCQTVTYTLAPDGDATEVRLSQYDHGSGSLDARNKAESTRNWEATLRQLKDAVERARAGLDGAAKSVP